MTVGPQIAMVAGEASGDLLAALLLAGLRAHWPGLAASGVGGPAMARAGFSAWWPGERLALHGYSLELLRSLHGLLRLRRQLRARLLAQRPALFIGVDAPDFNLALEADLRAAGIRTVHFVCPSIWAWRAQRVERLRRSADHVLCIFPFEPELLARHSICASYVGHPLASLIPMQPDRTAARAQLGLAGAAEVLAVLPGSRSTEVQHIAPVFFAAAALLRKQRPALRLLTPALPALRTRIEQAARASGLDAQALQIVDGQSHAVLAACDAALVASGTATLEAALFKRPMVIGYRMSAISWRLMRARQLQPWVGLPNILCREFVVPELLQQAATAQALCAAARHWLDARTQAPHTIAALEQRFAALHTSLQRDTGALAADAIRTLLGA